MSALGQSGHVQCKKGCPLYPIATVKADIALQDASEPSHRSGRSTSGNSPRCLQLSRVNVTWAMFNLAIDSKLRGCDVVAVTVDNIAPNG